MLDSKSSAKRRVGSSPACSTSDLGYCIVTRTITGKGVYRKADTICIETAIITGLDCRD